MTRVLLTATAASVDAVLVPALLAEPTVEHVLAVVRPDGATPPGGPRLTWVAADLGRARDLRRVLFGPARELGIDTVLHGPPPRRARGGGPRDHALVVDSTRELLHLAERHPTIRRFLYRSSAEVYRVDADLPAIIDEEHPLNFTAGAPDWVRDRLESDVAVSTRIGASSLRVLVLRCAEILARDAGSQLADYLISDVCLRPLGYDPMMNLLTVEDAARALVLALRADGRSGIYNIPGADVLPLSAIIRLARRLAIPLPDQLLAPLYRLRAVVRGTDFRYDMNRRRFHYSGVLDGSRARADLGFVPARRIDWSAQRGST